MGFRIKKIYIFAFIFAALVVAFLIYMTPETSPGVFNTYARPDNFKEGLWIVKYPENGACFRFETPEGYRIVADPYQMDEYVSPDLVTISHYHLDHCDKSKLGGKYRVIDKEGEFQDGKVGISGIKGLHDNPRVPSAGNTPVIMFVYDINGIKVAHLASEGVFPTEDMFGRIGKADIVILQMGDGGIKMSLDECRDIVKRVGAKIVIPAHGSQNLDTAFAATLNAKVKYYDDGEMIVTRGELDAINEPEIRMMDSY